MLAHLAALKAAAAASPPTVSLSLYHRVDVHIRTFILHTAAAVQVQAITRSNQIADITGYEDEQYELAIGDDEILVSASEILLFVALPDADTAIKALLDLHIRCLLNATKLLLKLAGTPLPDPLARPDGRVAYFDFDVKQPLLKFVLLTATAAIRHYEHSPLAAADPHLWLTGYYVKARGHFLLRQTRLCSTTINAGLDVATQTGSPSNLIPAMTELRAKCEVAKEQDRRRDKKFAKEIGKHVMGVMELSTMDLASLEN